MSLALAMERSRGRTHEDVAMLISLDAIGELGENSVSQNLVPASEVKLGLRREIRKLESDWHARKYARKNSVTIPGPVTKKERAALCGPIVAADFILVVGYW